MKIGAYSYYTKGERNTRVLDGLNICSGIMDELDLVIAPEYSNIPLHEIDKLSAQFPSVLFVLGTTLVRSGSSVFNRALVRRAGKAIIHTGEPILEIDPLNTNPRVLTHSSQTIDFYDKMSRCVQPGYCDRDHLQFELGNATFRNGNKPCVFDYFGKRVGLEICSDNTYGLGTSGNPKPILRTLVGESLDLQLILSCGNIGNPNALNYSGYMISVDGGEGNRPTACMFGPRGLVSPKGYKIKASPGKDDVFHIFKI